MWVKESCELLRSVAQGITCKPVCSSHFDGGAIDITLSGDKLASGCWSGTAWMRSFQLPEDMGIVLLPGLLPGSFLMAKGYVGLDLLLICLTRLPDTRISIIGIDWNDRDRDEACRPKSVSGIAA